VENINTNGEKKMFKYLKKKLIDMGFLCHTPKSALSCQDKKDIKQYGLIHFTFSKNINEISKNGVMPGKEYLYRKEKNLCWFYINYPKEYEKNLGIVKSKGKRSSVDCYIVIKDFSEEQLNNMRIRKESDNAVVHIGTLKTSNMKGMMLKDK
jgi:hypothetical protein